jgi:UDP-2,3-diacylglucosamine pyrophosphatase LpxH
MLKENHYKTIIISDVHLGTRNSKAKELVRFLKTNTCEKLLLNGDIIDGWQLRKGSKWKKKHTRFFRVILKMLEKHDTEIIYIRGNHDDFLDNLIPFSFNRLTIVKDYYLTSGEKKFFVLHGDIFDSITTNLRWLAKLGDIGYTFLLWLNKVYNNRRIRKGLPYFSLSQYIKQKVKSAVSYISDFEKELVSLAVSRNCHGVICGHIHHPSITQYEKLVYMNSGDWVESLSALVEDFEGNWKIIYYSDLLLEEQEEEEDE